MVLPQVRTLRSLTLAVALFLVLGGVVYALTQFTRELPAIVTAKVKAPDGIEIYQDKGLTQVADSISFGTAEIDLFGTISKPAVPVWVHNRSNSDIRLGVADNFDLGEVSLRIISRGATGSLVSVAALVAEASAIPPVAPNRLLRAGEVAEAKLLLSFTQKPSQGELKFTVTFTAQGPVPTHQPAFSQWQQFVRTGVTDIGLLPTPRHFGQFVGYVKDSEVLIANSSAANMVFGFRTWLYIEVPVSREVNISGDDFVALYVNGEFVAGAECCGRFRPGVMDLRFGWNKLEALVWNAGDRVSLRFDRVLGSLGVMDANASYDSAAPEPPIPVVTPTPTPTPQVARLQPKYGGIVPMHDFAFSPPARYPYKALQQIKNSSGIYNQLIEYDPETPDRNDIRGDLAKSWELSKDGLTYTFRLHENARWHDSKPVTAADVVFSLDNMMEPGAVRPLVRAALGTYYKRGTARAIDEHTVQLPTLFPAPELIPLLSNDRFKIVAKHWAESAIDTDKWENAMGSGPFKPGKFNKDVSVELVKNPDYWKKGLPYIDGMRHITIVDKGTAIAAYKTEQVLMTVFLITNLSSKEAVRLQEDAKDKLTVHFVPNTTFVGVMFNSTVKPFDDIRVRQAINLAIHRRTFVETIGAGPGTEAQAPALGSDTWFGKSAAEIATLPGYRELDGKKHPDDLAEAKRLLADAGFPNGFKADMMVRTVLEFPDMAQIAADQLRRSLNIDLTIKPIDSATGLARYGKRDYAIAVQATAHEVIEPDAIISKVWMPGGLYDEWTGWLPPKWFEEDFYKQSREVDPAKRKAILQRMEEYLIHKDPGPYVLLYWSPRNWIVNKRIKNLYPGPALWTSTRHENIYCDPKC